MACRTTFGRLRPSKLKDSSVSSQNHSALGGAGVLRSIFPVNEVSSPDSGAAGSKAPESRREKLKNSILAVLGRFNNLDTASQVIDVPPAQLEKLREEARKASRWNFLLGLLYLPWSIIQGEDYLIYQGIGFLVLGWYIKRLAQDDAKLLA